jgi:hypothetical protein
MDSFWSQAFDDPKEATIPSVEGGAPEGEPFPEPPMSAVPPRLQEAEQRLHREQVTKSNRERWTRSGVVALVLGLAVVAILWMWAPAAMCAKRGRSYDVPAPSPTVIAVWGVAAAAVGFAIGWNLDLPRN